MVLVTARAGGERGIGWSYAAAAAAQPRGRSAGAAWSPAARLRRGRARPRPWPARCATSAGRASRRRPSRRWTSRCGTSRRGCSACRCPACSAGPATASRSTAAAGSPATTSARPASSCAGWVEKDRIPRVKIKIGEYWGSNERRDLARVALAREVIGPDAELYVDANGGYTTGPGGAGRAPAGRATASPGSRSRCRRRTWPGWPRSGSQVLPDVAAGEYSWSLADSAAPDRRGRGGLPAARRDPVRRDHRVPARRRPGRRAPPAGLRALRAEPARARRRRRSRTCGTWSTSTTTSGSSGCCSTAPSTRTAAPCAPDPGGPGLGMTLRAADAEPFRRA